MNFTPLAVWVVYSNGNPYSWHTGRSAAFVARGKLEAAHRHARWTVEQHDAELTLMDRPQAMKSRGRCGRPVIGPRSTPQPSPEQDT